MSSRRLDALFAERVLMLPVKYISPGQGYSTEGEYSFFVSIKDWWVLANVPNGDYINDHTVKQVVPYYTTDLSAAWEGVEKIGWGDLQGPIRKRDKPYHMWVAVRSEDDTDGRALADTAPLAVVLACLRASNVSEEEIQKAIDGE